MLTVSGEFERPLAGFRLASTDSDSGFPLTGLPAWQSSGGICKTHPDRALPCSLEIRVPQGVGSLDTVSLLGVFALHAREECEAPGTVGAAIELWDESALIERFELANGRHYCDATVGEVIRMIPGDGTSLDSAGSTLLDGVRTRVDLLTLDLPKSSRPTRLKFLDQGTPASFLLFDVFFSYRPQHKCPFHPDSGGIPLSDIPAIVRVGDRARMQMALEQLDRSLLSMQDLDEARGEALTFLAVVTAATLETGASRHQHLLQLTAARALEGLASQAEVSRETLKFVETAAPALFQPVVSQNDALMNRAMALVNRHYARPLRDSDVAEHIGLSTSHFRHLFREATGQPFHQYLLALRLEKARAMISQSRMSVTDAARAAGFTGLSHFSRAFTDRFSVRPSEIRSAGAKALH